MGLALSMLDIRIPSAWTGGAQIPHMKILDTFFNLDLNRDETKAN